MGAIGGAIGGISSLAGIAGSFMGQKDARDEAERAERAQREAQEQAQRMQAQTDAENYLRYLQSIGYNAGQNPFLPDTQQYTNIRLAPWMVTTREIPEGEAAAQGSRPTAQSKPWRTHGMAAGGAAPYSASRMADEYISGYVSDRAG